ncbi:MAG: DUF5684 domain-containing protein [Bacilli bacterium]
MENVLFSTYFINVINIFLVISYSLSVLYVVFIMTSLYKVFKDKDYKLYYAFIPFYNLYILLKITGIPLFYYLLLFIPIGNIVLFIKVNGRLSSIYRKSAYYSLGMFFLPSIFNRLLLKKGSKKNSKNKEFMKDLVDDRTFEIDSLLTEEQYKSLNNEVSHDTDIDSVFKEKSELIEKAPTYKANRSKNKNDETEFLDL